MTRPRDYRSRYRQRRGKRDYAWPHNQPRSRPLPTDEGPVQDKRFRGRYRLAMLRRRMRPGERKWIHHGRSWPWSRKLRGIFGNMPRGKSWSWAFSKIVRAARKKRKTSHE